jgi:hypothetical protein
MATKQAKRSSRAKRCSVCGRYPSVKAITSVSGFKYWTLGCRDHQVTAFPKAETVLAWNRELKIWGHDVQKEDVS